LELQENKTFKTPTTGAEVMQTLIKNNSRSQLRLKQQDNHSPSKVNSTTKYPNTYVEEEPSNNELKKQQ
jgi:hypothetical protein